MGNPAETGRTGIRFKYKKGLVPGHQTLNFSKYLQNAMVYFVNFYKKTFMSSHILTIMAA